jgi:fucose 4-O-acetylase-like acetyltransferase
MKTICKRYDWVNAIRSIGIMMVVLGHTLGINESVEKYIYSYHMPLFFFISGLVLTTTRLSQDWVDATMHYGRRLLLPYLLFSILTYLPWVLVTRHFGADAALQIEPWQPLVGTLYGIGVDGWLQHNAMLWFFPCLFLVHLIFRMLYGLAKGWKLHALIVGLTGLGLLLPSLLPVRLPWGIEIALIVLPFYAIGQIFSSHDAWLPLASLRTALLALFFFILQFFCVKLNGRVDLNFISLGNPFLFYLAAFSGIGALGCVIAFLPPLRMFTALADAAILTFAIHRTTFSVFSAFGLWLMHDLQAFKLSIWGSISYTVGALLVAGLLFPRIRRWCPILIGSR